MTTACHIVTNSLCVLFLGVLAAACAPENDCLEHGTCLGSQSADTVSDPNAVDDAGADAGPSTSAPSCTVFGKPHIGLGGADLAATADGPMGGDRARAKPYTALLTEYGRVLGSQNTPSSIDETGSTFGIPADRWYLEPIASAVFVNTAFDVAFEGCLKLTGDTKYAEAPTKASASVVCAEWSRRFWSRAATPDQIDACVSVATETISETYGRPSVDETTRATTPKRRWAYACASVLTATGFLTF